MVNKTEGIFHDYRIYVPRKLQNKNNTTRKQSIKHIAQLKKEFRKKCFQKNLLDLVEKMTKMTKSKKKKKKKKKKKNDTLDSRL